MNPKQRKLSKVTGCRLRALLTLNLQITWCVCRETTLYAFFYDYDQKQSRKKVGRVVFVHYLYLVVLL